MDYWNILQYALISEDYAMWSKLDLIGYILYVFHLDDIFGKDEIMRTKNINDSWGLGLVYLFFLLNLLRYNWHTALYKFKVYSIMIRLILGNDYHNKFGKHLLCHIDTK